MRRRTILAAAAAIALLAGCGQQGGDTPSTPEETSQAPTTEPATTEPATEDPTTEPATEEPTDETGDEPPFPDSVEIQTSESSGEPDLVLSDVRVAEHEGYDRIVMEFTGSGTPGWTVDYVDEAVPQGMGDVIDLEGDAILDIAATGTAYPAEGEDHYRGPRQFEPDDGGDMEEIYVDGTFEGITKVIVGLDDEAPFRVFALTDPVRLVIDVQDVDD